MKTYLRLLSFARPYREFLPQYIILAVLGVLFGAVNFSMLIPLLNVLFGTAASQMPHALPSFSFSISYFTQLFNFYFYSILQEHGKFGALFFICLIILAFNFLANLFRYWAQRMLTFMRTKVVREMRTSLFEKLTSMHLGYFHSQQKGNLLSVISNDVQEVENSVVSSIQVVFRDPIVILVYFIILFIISPRLTLFTIVFLPISGIIIAFISRQLKKQSASLQKLLGRLLIIVDETLGGMRVVKGFYAEIFQQKKFAAENKQFTKLSNSIINKRELASPLSEFLGVSVVVGVILYGGYLVLNHQSSFTASQFIAYIALYSQILSPAKNISTAITTIQRGLAAGERVLYILDTPAEVKESPDAKSINHFTAQIEYRNASFSYDSTPVLKNINLVIPKGKMIALVGQSGAGKSTLADLLPRFYDVTVGELTIDSFNIKNLKIKDLRNLMGLVTQEPILFNDTIFNNIAFGVENADEDDVIRAAKVANAHEFILLQENGYQTNIGDRGTRLSGGQRQRLSIARAVFKNPPILILDEATSSLDTESERLVQDALARLMQNRTSIVIAHRLSTIQHADEIIVLQSGEIAERGTHDQLLTRNGIYKRLVEMQQFS